LRTEPEPAPPVRGPFLAAKLLIDKMPMVQPGHSIVCLSWREYAQSMSFSTAIQASGTSTIKNGYDMLASRDGRERDGFIPQSSLLERNAR
jgi:hypothetical protein